MKKLNKLQIAGISTAAVVVIMLITASVFYHGRWYNGTIINGIDVSNCTFEESKERLEEAFEDYGIEILGRENGKLSIARQEIDFRLSIDENLKEIYDLQHEKYFLFQLFTKKEEDCGVSFSKEKLKDLIRASKLVKGSLDYEIVKPQNAYLKYSKSKGALEIVPEVYGNRLDVNELCQKIHQALTNLEHTVDLKAAGNDENAYKSPEIKQDSTELIEELNRYNQVINHWISWDMGEDTFETITPDMIYRWISFDGDKLTVRKKRVRNWIEKLSAKYNTVGATRKFKTHSGKKIEISGGDYGWILDSGKMTTQAVKAIKKLRKQEKIDTYLSNPSEENKQSLTDVLEPQYVLTGARKDYETFSEDWDPKNYIEVSLEEQKVYVWRKGKCVFTAKCITGKPVPERQTKTGTYYIKERMPAKTLVGEDYRTPVKYWTRIMWSGTGFHSATWQNWSKWTKNYYKYRGSHGCINLSLNDAAKIYELAESKEAVFIY